MAFSVLESRWSALVPTATPTPYTDAEQVLPIYDEPSFAAVMCIFNPVRRADDDVPVVMTSLAPSLSRQHALQQFEHAAAILEDIVVDGVEFVPPEVGAPDPIVWHAMERALPHEDVKIVLFPTNPDNELELSWSDHSRRMSTHGQPSPILWWDQTHTYVVATPWESSVTYVAGPELLIDRLCDDTTIETERLI